MGWKRVEFVTSVFDLEDLPQGNLPEVAFAGRSNVGKSSLLNRLLGRKRLVKVSSTPGFTQSLNFFLVDGRYHLVDLPGYGYARAPRPVRRRWRGLVEGYLQERRVLIGVVCILDIRRDVDQLDLGLFHYLRSLGKRAWVVLNKADKIGQPGRYARSMAVSRMLPGFVEGPWVVSARTGLGVKELSEHLDGVLAAGG